MAFSAELLYNYGIYRIWVILTRISIVPDHVKAEWVRRLRWALRHDFTSLATSTDRQTSETLTA